MGGIKIFDKYYNQYDRWFKENESIYLSELNAIKHFIPKNKKGLEVGVGTGRFAGRLGIKYGIEPSKQMAKIAIQRGIKVFKGVAEKLPFEDESFEFLLFVTTFCFIRNVSKALKEARRVLKRNGFIVIGFLDKSSELGKEFLKKRKNSKFYIEANFYSTEKVIELLEMAGFHDFSLLQTVFNKENKYQKFKKGFGKGLFVVVKAVK